MKMYSFAKEALNFRIKEVVFVFQQIKEMTIAAENATGQEHISDETIAILTSIVLPKV